MRKFFSLISCFAAICAGADTLGTNTLARASRGGRDGTGEVADLGTVVVEGSALSKYRPEKVTGGTFTGEAPEKLPVVVDTLTEDFIRERNPTDLNDLLRWVPGIETGGTSLLVRQPGLFSIRGMGGTEPAFDGFIPVGRGAGLFMDPYTSASPSGAANPAAATDGTGSRTSWWGWAIASGR